jgi:hypothetical protein
MKDLGKASYVLGIEIHRDMRNGVLELSQKSYIEKVLKKFNMLRALGRGPLLWLGQAAPPKPWARKRPSTVPFSPFIF